MHNLLYILPIVFSATSIIFITITIPNLYEKLTAQQKLIHDLYKNDETFTKILTDTSMQIDLTVRAFQKLKTEIDELNNKQ